MSGVNNNGKKHIVINEELHTRLKIKAALEKRDLGELTEKLILKALQE